MAVKFQEAVEPRDDGAARIGLLRDVYRFLEDVQEYRRDDFDEAYGEWFDESFELLLPSGYPEGAQAFRARAGLRRWIAGIREIWDEWRLAAERFIVAGDHVVVLIRLTAKGRLSRVRLERETAHIWDIADDRVTRCEIFLDRSEALRKMDPAITHART